MYGWFTVESPSPLTGPHPQQVFNVFCVCVCVFFLTLTFERQSMNKGGVDRERETQNLKQAPGSKLSAQSLTRGLNPQTMGS